MLFPQNSNCATDYSLSLQRLRATQKAIAPPPDSDDEHEDKDSYEPASSRNYNPMKCLYNSDDDMAAVIGKCSDSWLESVHKGEEILLS